MRTIAPLTLKDLTCKSPRRAPGPEGKSGDGEPDSDEDEDRHGLSRRPTLSLQACGAGQVTSKKLPTGSLGASCPAPLDSDGGERTRKSPQFCQLILKCPGRGDAEQLSERGAHLLLLRRDSCGVPSSHRLSPGCSESDCR